MLRIRAVGYRQGGVWSGSPHHFVSGVLPCPNGVLLGERWWQNFSDTLAASGVTPWREPFKADLRDAGVGNRTVRAIVRLTCGSAFKKVTMQAEWDLRRVK